MKLCTLTGHSGQDEYQRLIDSVLYTIGQNFVKLCPHVVLINFGSRPTIVTQRNRRRNPPWTFTDIMTPNQRWVELRSASIGEIEDRPMLSSSDEEAPARLLG